ncbi:hypothetical protein [Marinicauda sp. Alg238-R41]|uniref:hypothetical protein n=1 Tax=Marinicauda sp. Alg238-R41 TaxID=2993447 RepID=UPI0022E6C067|nr:hypothetical protein [Marinicauda sp. Alg238-R41]
MRIESGHIIAAAAAILATSATASAQSALPGPSQETRAMIMGPLVSRIEAQSGVRAANEASLSSAPAVTYINARSTRPNVTRFAAEALDARSPLFGRRGVSGFSGREATLESSGNSRVIVSISEANDPSNLFSNVSPDYVEAGGMRVAGIGEDRARSMGLSYETRFDAVGRDNSLDVGIAPRAGVSLGQFGPSYEAGATLRVGQYVKEELEGRPAWWLFAGADRETVMFDPGEGLSNSFAYGETAMVGDAQAGVAMRFYGADLSVAYVHRETTYSIPTHSWETSEGFAAFSLSLQH